MAPEEAIEQLGHEGMQAMGADATAGLPHDFGGGGNRGTIGRGRPRPGAGPGRGARRSKRMAALRWRPVTATISSKSWRSSRRGAAGSALAGARRTPASSVGSRWPPGGMGNRDFRSTRSCFGNRSFESMRPLDREQHHALRSPLPLARGAGCSAPARIVSVRICDAFLPRLVPPRCRAHRSRRCGV